MNAGFYGVEIYSRHLGRVVTTTVFADDAEEARSRVEIEGLRGHGLEEDESIVSVNRLQAEHLPA